MLATTLCVCIVFGADPAPPLPLHEILENEKLVAELEILDEQAQQAKNIWRIKSAEAHKRIREIHGDEEIEIREKAELMQEAMKGKDEAIKKSIVDNVLLPHQMERADQIAWRVLAQKDILAAMERSGVIDSDHPKHEELVKIAEEEKAKLQELIKEQLKKTELRILMELKQTERNHWDKVVGEELKTPPDFVFWSRLRIPLHYRHRPRPAPPPRPTPNPRD